MLDPKKIQQFLNVAGGYALVVDGVFGLKSYTAGREFLSHSLYTATWSDERTYIALSQMFLNATIGAGLLVDGLAGPMTLAAIARYEALSVKPVPILWPRQADVPAYFGPITLENQSYAAVPYPMYAEYSRASSTFVSRILCHRLVKPAVERILKRTLAYYGQDKIRRYNLDIFSGCRVIRKITGGVGYSMHSWGIALDFDAAHNEFSESRATANFAEPRYQQFIDFWYDEGAINLGRERNYDFMHFQFSRL